MQENTPANVRALCCECGNVRTVSAKYHRRDQNRSCDDGRDRRGWRMTTTLKCSVCKQPTRHALLRDDVPPTDRDHAESLNRGNRPERKFECLPATRS